MFSTAVRQSSSCFAYVDSDRLGPEIVTVFEIKGQVLHRVRLHVKVPGLVVRLKCAPK